MLDLLEVGVEGQRLRKKLQASLLWWSSLPFKIWVMCRDLLENAAFLDQVHGMLVDTLGELAKFEHKFCGVIEPQAIQAGPVA